MFSVYFIYFFLIDSFFFLNFTNCISFAKYQNESPQIADYFTHFAQTAFPIDSTAEWPARFPRAIPFPLMLFLPRSPSASTRTTPPG